MLIKKTAAVVLASIGLLASLTACGSTSSGASIVKTALESGSDDGWCGGSDTGNHAYSGISATETDTEGTYEWTASDGYKGTAHVNIDDGCVTSASVSTN